MKSMMASHIAHIIGGSLVGEDVLVTSAPSLKSSEIEPGGIFLAMQGERVDGHDFVEDAFSHGAHLAITSRTVAQRHILVKDVPAALTALARFVRSELKDLKVIGITGSQARQRRRIFCVICFHSMVRQLRHLEITIMS